MGVIVNTDLNFIAEGPWIGLHDWWTRQLQCEEKLFHPGFLESERVFQGDSGGPLWVRQKRKGMENGKRKLPVAYLVGNTIAVLQSTDGVSVLPFRN